MSIPNNFNNNLNFKEKELLPKYLINEIIGEEVSNKNFNNIERNMFNMHLNDRINLNNKMIQPKRKGNSHNNVNFHYNSNEIKNFQSLCYQPNNTQNSYNYFNCMNNIYHDDNIQYNNNLINRINEYNISNINNNIRDDEIRRFIPKRIISSNNIMEFTKSDFRPKPTKKNISSKSINMFTDEDKEVDLNSFLNKIGKDLIQYIKTQKGSRSLQKYLNKINPESINTLLENISMNLKEIMCDSYGNYLIQRLIQSCSAQQRIFILKNIERDFMEIAINISGTHSLQSLIEIATMTEEENIINKMISPVIQDLSFDVNGTHIIQKVICCFNENSREYLNEYILENLSYISMNVHGICVVKKFISCTKSDKIKIKLLSKFEKNAIEIVQDPFGNYAIQYIIEIYGADVCQNILTHICKYIISLSMQKFSSNVVEKCLENLNQKFFKKATNDLFDINNFNLLLKNKYGSFVLQKAINLMNLDDKKEIREILTKIHINGSKEKNKLNMLIELL